MWGKIKYTGLHFFDLQKNPSKSYPFYEGWFHVQFEIECPFFPSNVMLKLGNKPYKATFPLITKSNDNVRTF